MSIRRNSTPYLFVIAGPNGAGKTTFAREFLPRFAKCREFVNADLIAGGLSPFAPGAAAVEAGRIMHWLTPGGFSITQEASLTSSRGRRAGRS